MTPWGAVCWLACWLAVLLGGGPVFIKLILPALLEAKDPGFRPIKYALFPPLGWLPPPATVPHDRSKESGTPLSSRS